MELRYPAGTLQLSLLEARSPPARSQKPCSEGPFDENGRMKDEEEEEDEWQDPCKDWEENESQEWWSQQSWWQSQSHYTANGGKASLGSPDRQTSVNKTTLKQAEISEQASEEPEKFLPDFVVAWMLLQRSGLDSSERATIIARLKNEFTTIRMKEALKLNWTEEDLQEERPSPRISSYGRRRR